MSLGHGASIVRDGLVCHLDPANLAKLGASPYTDLIGNTTATNTDFTEVDGIWRSNANSSTGAGTSEITFSGFEIISGSFTVTQFFKITSEPNVGTNNNYRMIFSNNSNSQSPFGILMEENRYIQYTLYTTVRQYRYLNGFFTQYQAPLNTWVSATFAYDNSVATGYAYRDDTLIRSGNMSTTSDQSVSAAIDEKVTDITTSTIMQLSNNRNVTDPAGAGCFPGDIGPCLVYNRALTETEVKINHEALRGRYGL